LTKILVVDDDPLILHIVESVLESDFRVITCDSGEDALSTINKYNNFDLAIFDIDMPGLSGIETAKTIWNQFKIPFIIFSQFNDEKFIDEAIEIGALTYLLKPINPSELLPAVKAALSRASDMTNKDSRAIELTHTINQNRILLSDIIHTEESYRKHLVNDLHDEVGQKLAVIRMGVNKIKTLSQDTSIQENCDQVLDHVFDLHKSVREIMMDLRPEILETVCTGSALHHLIVEWSKMNILVDIDATMFNKELQLSYPEDIILYRSLQEALTNISKYANATEVSVTFRETNEGVILTVCDNGKGFSMKDTPFSIGLSGIREKVLSVGGEFKLDSKPGEGVSLRLSLPIKESD